MIEVAAVLELLGKGADIAIQVLKKKNLEENRKYIDEYYDAEIKLGLEKAKPSEDQMDNVVEGYQKKLAILFEVAKREMDRQAGDK